MVVLPQPSILIPVKPLTVFKLTWCLLHVQLNKLSRQLESLICIKYSLGVNGRSSFIECLLCGEPNLHRSV